MFDVQKIRKDFPFLTARGNGKPVVYFDNAATTQKPKQVINALADYYERKNANPHRGVYELSEEATEEYENARKKTAEFIGASNASEIVFTKNTTEGINLVKNAFARTFLKKGDRILVSVMEHHSNLVPWILLEQEGIALDYIEVTPDGMLDSGWEKRITPKTKMLCITHASNVLGTINDVEEICGIAKGKGCITLVDGAQAVPHLPVNVQKIGCDFYVFSGHKMLAPMGVGVLYGRKELLEKMPPFLAGGDMIRRVERHKAEFNELPWKFEAGTPDVGAAVGLGAAIDYLNALGLDNVKKHEEKLVEKMLNALSEFPKIKVLDPKNAREGVGIVSFMHEKIHPHDLASVMNENGVAIRSGPH